MSKHQPPKLPRKIFEWYCGNAPVDDLLGDMDEWFYKNLETRSLFRARLKYWRHVFSLLFSYSVRKRKSNAKLGLYSTSPFAPAMMGNYFKVAFRNLARHKYFSLINIFGLAMGMSVGLFLIGCLSFIRNYDNFHRQKENIYRIVSAWTNGVDSYDYAPAPAALASKLKTEYSLPVEAARLNRTFEAEVVIARQNMTLYGYYTDPSFLEIFNFPLVSGDFRQGLKKPNSLLLTKQAAHKLFGDAEATGKVVELKGLGHFEVSGVMKDLPKNTHFEFEALVSYNSLPAHLQGNGTNSNDWREYFNQYVYLKLLDPNKLQDLQHALKKIEQEVYSSGNPVHAKFSLQPLGNINPGPDYRRNLGISWDYVGLTGFALLSILILLPACFNYTNLSIARAIKRAKEIGMRKTLGSQNGHIFAQLITETVVITFIALALGIGIFVILRNQFLNMLVESNNLDLSITSFMLVAFVGFALITGLLSGIAPALFFSRLNPIQALKNMMANGHLSGQRVRKALTVFQFAASFSFILIIVVFARQYRYTMNYNFGFQRANILDIELQDVNRENFRTEFSRFSNVQDISMSSGVPGLNFSSTHVSEPGKTDSLEVFQIFVDHRYIPNLKLKLAAGENFQETPNTAEKFIIVNEEFLRVQNISNPIDAIGKGFIVDDRELTIIGVVKDFNFGPLQERIRSFFFRNNPEYFTHANLKVSFADAYTDISAMEKKWKTLTGSQTFTAKFLDDEIAEAYDFYASFLKLLGYLGGLALTISVMGMLGMVVYTAETRTKEVGIRKVMGATSWGLTLLLSRDFIKLILFGALLASPLAIWILDKFLLGVQYYSVRLSVWDMLTALMILLSIGLAAITSQTIKTAGTNPVDTLRTE